MYTRVDIPYIGIIICQRFCACLETTHKILTIVKLWIPNKLQDFVRLRRSYLESSTRSCRQ